MFPFIRSGDSILVKRVPLETIKPNDTILFESEDKMKICHKVITVLERDGVLWFSTAGYKDSSQSEGPINKDNILGKVIALKRKDKIIDLTGRQIHTFGFRVDCFFTEIMSSIRNFLAKIPWIKKTYKLMMGEAGRANSFSAVKIKS